MENYLDKCMALSDSIVGEIRDLMAANGELIHDFKNIFSYCWQCEQEAGLQDVYFLEKDNLGVWFSDKPHNTEKVQSRSSLSNLTAESLARLLQNLKDEYWGAKVQRLRKLIEDAGGELKFDGEFTFTGDANGDTDENIDPCEGCQLTGLKIVNGKMQVLDFWDGGNYNNTEHFLPYEELDRIISYVEDQTRKVDIQLTDEQLKVMDEFYAAVKKMEDAGISVIRDVSVDGGFYFINGKGIDIVSGFDADVTGYTNITEQLDDLELYDLSDHLWARDCEGMWAKRID